VAHELCVEELGLLDVRQVGRTRNDGEPRTRDAFREELRVDDGGRRSSAPAITSVGTAVCARSSRKSNAPIASSPRA
jgi:hypothetical protein